MGSTELIEIGPHLTEGDSLEVSDDTRMYNPLGIPLIKAIVCFVKNSVFKFSKSIT